MKKIFFSFDVDNTLAVWPDGIIPKSAQMTLDTLKANGHRVALATGRLQIDARRFADMANVHDFVADGGKSVTVNNEIYLWKAWIEKRALTTWHNWTGWGFTGP